MKIQDDNDLAPPLFDRGNTYQNFREFANERKNEFHCCNVVVRRLARAFSNIDFEKKIHLIQLIFEQKGFLNYYPS